MSEEKQQPQDDAIDNLQEEPETRASAEGDESRKEQDQSEHADEQKESESEIKDEQPEEVSSPDKKPEQKKPKQDDVKQKAKPAEQKKPSPKKDEDFRYIVRIANTDVSGEKTIVYGLAQIKGIGRRMGVLIADAAGIQRDTKVGDLSDAQIEKIKEILKDLPKKTPSWMLNHRKDFDTGEDIHLVSSEVDMRLRDEVKLLKMIRSYGAPSG